MDTNANLTKFVLLDLPIIPAKIIFEQLNLKQIVCSAESSSENHISFPNTPSTFQYLDICTNKFLLPVCCMLRDDLNVAIITMVLPHFPYVDYFANNSNKLCK